MRYNGLEASKLHEIIDNLKILVKNMDYLGFFALIYEGFGGWVDTNGSQLVPKTSKKPMP